jgi:CelD/BcsL family acetyltransferase involved in cellulose biosynthesis
MDHHDTVVRVLTRADEFEALRADWNELAGRCDNRSVFLTHEWLDAAWQWRQATADLYVLCYMRSGRLVAALPLVRAKRNGRPGRILEFLTVPDTQFCDMVAPPEEHSPSAAMFADELLARGRQWDVLHLNYLPREAIAAKALGAALSSRGVRCHIDAAIENPIIALNSEWDTYYGTRSRRLKKAVNLAANRLAKAGEVRVHWLAPATGAAADVDRAVDQVTAISARSWKTRTGNSLDNPGPQAFIRRLAHHAHRLGWLSVWTLALDSRPIAMEFQLVADGDVFALRSDFDTKYEELSPGSHLSRCMLERLFHQGWRRYLMGPGGNPYKYRWADAAEPVGAMSVYGRSLRGRGRAAWDLALKPAARRIRDRLQRPQTAAPKTQDIDEAQ